MYNYPGHSSPWISECKERPFLQTQWCTHIIIPVSSSLSVTFPHRNAVWGFEGHLLYTNIRLSSCFQLFVLAATHHTWHSKPRILPGSFLAAWLSFLLLVSHLLLLYRLVFSHPVGSSGNVLKSLTCWWNAFHSSHCCLKNPLLWSVKEKTVSI